MRRFTFLGGEVFIAHDARLIAVSVISGSTASNMIISVGGNHEKLVVDQSPREVVDVFRPRTDHLAIVVLEVDAFGDARDKIARLQTEVGRELRLTSFVLTAAEGKRVFFMIDTTTDRFAEDRAKVIEIAKRIGALNV